MSWLLDNQFSDFRQPVLVKCFMWVSEHLITPVLCRQICQIWFFRGDEQYLYVGGWDIKTGDTFSFYTPNVNRALASCGTVFENFGKLKHKEMIGGFVFACCGRGETFFGKPNVDSSPILDNFPTIPLAGMYCGAEIGRGSPNLGKSNEEHEQDFPDTHSHVYSTIYLLMSYSSPSRP